MAQLAPAEPKKSAAINQAFELLGSEITSLEDAVAGLENRLQAALSPEEKDQPMSSRQVFGSSDMARWIGEYTDRVVTFRYRLVALIERVEL